MKFKRTFFEIPLNKLKGNKLYFYGVGGGKYLLISYIMKKSVFFFSLFCFMGISLYSQRVVTISYQQDSKGVTTFSCFNNAFCNYILDFGFTVFTNLKCDQPLPLHQEVKPGYTKLFAISVMDPNSPVQFKFTSGYQKGCMSPVINRDFTYLLPISPGRQAQIYEMTPEKGTDSASGWYVLRIRMNAGDTIYAARKGFVNEQEDDNMEIVHADCSFARYGILKKNSAFVHTGQFVKAGQPIGLVGGDEFNRGSDVRFSVYYYQSDIHDPGKRIPYYIPLQIWTRKNGKGRLKHGAEYISEFPASLINQESSPVPAKNTKSKKK
jgi:hypothetical protein